MSETKKILIIDDDTDILFTIQEICHFCGFEATTASNGEDGYKLAQKLKPNLIIVDYHMPGWDGLTTVKKIKSLGKNIAILVLTVDTQQETADKFMAEGATDFSIKPIKAPDLIARIKVNLQIQEIQKKMEERKEQTYLEKGICSATLRLILDYLEDQTDGQTYEEISAGVNLAYQTVHRYIQYLLEHQTIDVIPIYGQLGRPKNKYALNKYVKKPPIDL